MHPMRIPWETVSNGEPVRILGRGSLPLSPAILRTIALAKLCDVELVSAEFENGEYAVFERLVTLFIDNGMNASFWGCYAREDVSKTVPTICLRIGEWDGQRDRSALNNPETISRYLWGPDQVKCSMSFWNAAACPSVIRLTESLREVIVSAAEFACEDRPFTQYRRVALYGRWPSATQMLAFDSGDQCAPALEQWIEKWKSEMGKLISKNGVLPRQIPNVSYSYDVLAEMREMSRDKS